MVAVLLHKNASVHGRCVVDNVLCYFTRSFNRIPGRLCRPRAGLCACGTLLSRQFRLCDFEIIIPRREQVQQFGVSRLLIGRRCPAVFFRRIVCGARPVCADLIVDRIPGARVIAERGRRPLTVETTLFDVRENAEKIPEEE